MHYIYSRNNIVIQKLYMSYEMNIFTMFKDIIFFLNRNEFVTVSSNECLSVTHDKKMKMLISLIKMIIQVLPVVLSL